MAQNERSVLRELNKYNHIIDILNEKRNFNCEVPFLVEATGFEPTTLWSRTIRATNCATPQYMAIIHIFCFSVNQIFNGEKHIFCRLPT